MNLRISQFLRLITIHRVFARYQLDEIIFELPWYLRYLLPWHWLKTPLLPRAIRIRRALEDLGPIFVKFGQMIGTRADLLPDDIVAELTLLQDQVTPFSGVEARQLVETALGGRIEDFFQEFDVIPIAAASVAQVHAARLHNGRAVVVKILRPNIRPIIRHDLDLLYTIADLAQRYSPDARRLRPRAVVAELEKTIWNELDLIREAANGATLRRNFLNSEMLYIPNVEWDYTRADILVLERIYGTKVSDVPNLIDQGVNLKLLAERGVEVFFTQVFQHNFFHADMHPGNIFVVPPACYIAVDFGIMGSLSHQDQRYLAENLLAFFRRDYRQVAEVHIASGWVAPDTRVDEFEAAIRSVCEPIFQRPFGEISFGHLLLRLFQVARSFNMEVQPQLVLLQKTLLNIEGMGRNLYPQLNLWTTAQPFLEKWMAERLGAWSFMRKIMEKAPHWGEQLPELPLLVTEILRQWHEAQIQNRAAPLSEMKMLTQAIQRTGERLILALLGAILLIMAIIFQTLDKSNSPDNLLFFNMDLNPVTLSMLGGSGILFFITWRLRN